MASCITEQWAGSTTPQVRLTVTLNSDKSDGDTAALDWKLEYVGHGYSASVNSAKSYTVTINGSSVKTGTYNYGGITGTATIDSGSVNIAKGTSAKTVSFSLSFAFGLTWSGSYKGTVSASGTISISAKTKYTVTYNANGGTGAPSSQTKWYGTTLTLSSTKPTRTGYTFQGWGTTSTDTSVNYAAGASYTSNAGITLYAIWKANTYTIKYNANGGTGAPGNQTKTYGVTLKLSTTKPTRTDYNFLGWATSSSATKAEYAAGANYTTNSSKTLYAVWELAYVKPRISKLSLVRCDEAGVESEEGTNASVYFEWECDKEVTSIEVSWKTSAETSWHQESMSASGTSGVVDAIVGNNSIDNELIYSFRATVADASGSTTASFTLNGLRFIIDFLAGGNGVAIGKAAKVEGALDVYMQTIIRGNEDASSTAASGQLIIGDPNGTHIAMDNNEIMAKASATTQGNITINYDGGNIGLGNPDSTIIIGQGNAVFRPNGNLDLTNRIARRFSVDTSNAASIIQGFKADGETPQFMIGAHNMGGAGKTGAIYIIPRPYTNTWQGDEGLYIGDTNLKFNDMPIVGNNVLWSGGWMMTAGHTCELSSPISAQAHGVFLVFCYYQTSDSTIQNTNYQSFFVPKKAVADHPGNSWTCGLARTNLTSYATKYLYINDATITGHANNNATGTASGTNIKYDNRTFVLRYVIGV